MLVKKTSEERHDPGKYDATAETQQRTRNDRESCLNSDRAKTSERSDEDADNTAVEKAMAIGDAVETRVESETIEDVSHHEGDKQEGKTKRGNAEKYD